MKDSLTTGVEHTLTYELPGNRTVPNLLPEASDFTTMPEVLATGYMVGIIEWACMEAIRDHLDEGEISLGTHVNFSHQAPTVPGNTVTVDVKVIAVEKRTVTFEISARDTHNVISNGTHQRGVISKEKFESRLPSMG
ncbi:thioesterase family protein [Corynebacterium suicordis]|uniref:Thioesterase family protein n=1 Tax=Corynebacterium suicordis DSM 45110 TaxID=1121369 RepID=A0ABR9ZIF5_9CORY|nr:thioesterase family protein [Corynebacterium suicordis]MBF4553147.1 thioesterase family protein [Corynebacterium suicordis DSM 45110]MDR6277890.1 fluoroacetyl-CoA thioesterase [Corynebacterium suicordis]